jgi:hypothetical protein
MQPPLFKRAIRQLNDSQVPFGRSLPADHERISFRNWQGFQQNRVDGAEDRRRRADRQGERDDDRSTVATLLLETAKHPSKGE